MAKTILDDAVVLVNNVDISQYVDTVEIDETWEDNDVTGMGAKAREHLLGLNDPSIKLTVFQSFEAAAVDATLAPLAGANVPFPVTIQPTSGPTSATNPKYEMQALLSSYSPLKGQVGKPSMTDITLVNGDQSGIVKHTT